MADDQRRTLDTELAARAKKGDKTALAELRRRGYFLRLKEESGRPALSRSQLRLWLLERLGADGAAYNLPALYRTDRALDAAALARAFGWLSARHGQLRVHFREEEGSAKQIIEPAATFVPPFAVHEAETFSAALTEARSFAASGFSLANPPLWRAGLWRVNSAGADAGANACGLFAWVFHHALADEWTLGLLADELARAYAAYAAGEEPDIPAPAISYFDWTEREAEYVAGPKGTADREWWLAGWLPPPPPLDLPTDFPRPTERSFAGGVAGLDWDENLAAGLAGLARREGATPFALALALTRIFLFRLTGQDDSAVGFPHANRDAAGSDAVAGFMANTLALRRRLDAAAPFAGNLRGEAAFLREALTRAAYPFDSLVEHAAPPRDPSRSPIFDVMATLRPAGDGAGMEGFSPINSGYAKARFDVVFEWKETAGGGLAGLDLTYATSLFGPERAGEWLKAIETMARAALASPELPVAELPLLDEAGRAEAAAMAVGARVPLPWETDGQSPLAWLWRESLAANPDGSAAEDREGVWTYRELDAMSRRIAVALRRAGCKAGGRVAVVLPRTRRLAAALWGIWRSGGAYVPVEAEWPEARRRFVIADSEAAFVFSDAEADAGGAAWLDPAAALADETATGEWPDPADGSDEWVPADGLAYIIYTSGSTGTPKGVAVPPRGVVNMALAQAAAFGIGPADRALALASTAFDASIAEMLVGWARAACVVMAPPGIAADVAALADWLPAAGVTIATVTPALLSLLPRAALAGVGTLLTAGEAARGSDIRPLLDRTRVVNAYGPTECSVCATLHRVTTEDCGSGMGVPIGFPIANVETFVLDAAGQPALPDTAGDLWLGGVGLAHGYWNRPDLTRDAFRESDLSAGGVLYRTGDRARRRRGGELLFLGRRDGQVKIRGHRVEVQEVERSLADALPERGTAVLPHRAGGEGELVALIAGGDGGDADADIARARRLLAERLPAAMRPGRYVTVRELPRDANGKVDRRALAALLARLDGTAGSGREPSRRYEREVLTAWREALGHSRLGLPDDFFLAGGHSLSVLRAAALTAEKTGRTVTARDIFAHPTAEGLAAALAAREESLPAEAVDAAETEAMPMPERENARPAGTGAFSAVSAEPLDGRIRRGDLPGLDAAALGYFPDAPPAGLDPALWTRERVIGDWCGGKATLLHVYDTPFGRTGLVALPLFNTDLFTDNARVMERIGEGLAVAKACGAGVVSLTGMLPSVTSGGLAVAERFPEPDWPAVTHGHASTAAALLKGAEKLLAAAGRDWNECTAGFLGLGSVGELTARLWLNSRPPPGRLILADVPAKRAALEALATAWRERSRSTWRREMDVRVMESPASPPDGWYEADLMLCAVGAGEIVDVARLKPGALLADDSAPACFSWEAAAERMRVKRDVLTIESGDLALPEPWKKISYRPEGLRERLADDEPHPADARRITSCVLSGLLLARGLADCPRTLGAADTAAALAHWRGLAAAGVTAPEFRCGAMRPAGIFHTGG